ncbi:hypothetical protein [Mycetocola sp.]|uniref:hypothetical protein n=1 Tax=Mycetocola sp. TaxID=1871042 RepID=UPI0039898719
MEPPTKPTGPVKVARFLWLASFVVGLAVLAFAFLSRDDQIKRLSDVIADVDPNRAAETLTSAATIVFWSSFGAIAVVVVLEALLLRAVLRRHRWAQWAQLLVLLAHTGVVLLAGTFLALGDAGVLIAALLIVQLVLGVVALVVSVLPGSGAWFQTQTDPGADLSA